MPSPPANPGFRIEPLADGPFFTLGYRYVLRGPERAVRGHFRTAAEAQAIADELTAPPGARDRGRS